MNEFWADDFPVPVACVTLGRSKERQEQFSKYAANANLPFQFHYGVDAAEDDSATFLARAVDQRVAVQRIGRELAKTEVAVSATHHRLYEKLIASGAPGAVILEDDVSLAPEFGEVARQLARRMNHRAHFAELVLFGGREGFEHRPLLLAQRTSPYLTDQHQLCRVLQSDGALQRTCCYYVTREGARAILDRERPITAPSDVWDRMRRANTLEAAHCIHPPVAAHPSEPTDSIVAPLRDMTQRHTSAMDKLTWCVRRGDYHRLIRAVARRFGYDACKRELYKVLGRFL